MIRTQKDPPATIGLARQVLTAVPDLICQLYSIVLPAVCLLGPSEAAAGMGSHHFCADRKPEEKPQQILLAEYEKTLATTDQPTT